VSEDGDRSGDEAHRGLLRRTLDLCVFAPVGVAVTVVEDLPELIAKGHRRVGLELGNARVVGRFVVHKGQRHVSGRIDDLWRNGTPDSPTDELLDHPEVEERARDDRPPPAPAPARTRDPAAAAIVSGALADYDTLSASQVVRRLDGLGTDELGAVLRYEASHRNRRTILNRANQLLEAPAPVDTPAHPGTEADSGAALE
jgi:hypothetical protein